jgi:hypothetical protein
VLCVSGFGESLRIAPVWHRLLTGMEQPAPRAKHNDADSSAHHLAKKQFRGHQSNPVDQD